MTSSLARRLLLVGCCALLLSARPGGQAPAHEPGLLFHLSGERGLTADVAASGGTEPNFSRDVKVLPNGARGAYLECGHTQLLSYWAPGNIYAERGTLSFFWRSREPVGPTAFPIFRVGYADHSSWDMVWLRIDYNGTSGFDAFVTDASLARTRVSYRMPAFPEPDEWVHLALAWDETRGIRFYVNGRLAARQDGTAVFDAALDQFGPHSRIISPYQVQSAYNFVRGGDIDEIRIYDRMLADGNVASLASGQGAGDLPAVARDVQAPEWREAWWYRHGWNRPTDPPPPLEGRHVSIRKVEIHDAYDLKRWWWKANDGIRETTWPGVYNRSRLPGRHDYFTLPDWDCYSLSGQSVTFTMPDEPWNHLEFSGSAWGTIALAGSVSEPPADDRTLFERPSGQERTYHRLAQPVSGRKVRFTNVEQEMPIGEFAAYHVAAGREPAGAARLTYTLTAGAEPDQPSVEPARDFITGRFASDARATMVALPAGAPRTPRGGPHPAGLPIVHVVVPSDFRYLYTPQKFSYTWANMPEGLDGIALDLPALSVAPTHGEYVPLNIQVKDPIWPLRAMFDVNVSMKPGEPHTLWLDLRDRFLPADRGLYLTIASAAPEFGPAALEGAELRLIFKPRRDAIGEHVLDRFTQVRDTYAQLVEETPNTRRLNYYNKFEGDLTDLLRIDPEHELGRQYWYDRNKEQPKPPAPVPPTSPGAPTWAFRQVEQLKHLRRFVNWYIDHRQIDNGEFGGGLSDDGDLTNWWPGTALMGATPAKITESLLRHMDAFYAQGLFTKGLPTIQTDELHSYEEGIQVLGQALMLDHGSPKQLERAMETALGIEGITGINAAGHRHIRSSYFSGTTIAEEGVWGWSKPSSYLILHPAIALVDYNGSPRVKKYLLELADGLLAHRKADANGRYTTRSTVRFFTDEDVPGEGAERAYPLLWAAYRWTGDRKYLQPFVDGGPRALALIPANALDLLGKRDDWGPAILESVEKTGSDPLRHLAWEVSGDTKYLDALYASQIQASKLREYINTEGSLWIDRVTVDHVELQRARLGGLALARNAIVPGHVVGWTFTDPSAAERVGILVRTPARNRVRIVAHNIGDGPAEAQMTAWDMEPGTWRVTQGTGSEAPDAPIQGASTRRVALERGEGVTVTFAPHVTTVIDLSLETRDVPYWSRPDLGISRDDVRATGRTLSVRVHSLGAVDSPASRVVVRDGDGRTIGSSEVPALRAPVGATPVSREVRVVVSPGATTAGATVTIEPTGSVREITSRNNRVDLGRRDQGLVTGHSGRDRGLENGRSVRGPSVQP